MPHDVLAKHKVGMTGEPSVDADGALVLGRRPDIINIEPCLIAFRLACLALAEEQNVDDHVRTGFSPGAAFGQTDRGNQVGRLRDMLTRRAIRLVHGAMAGDERGKRSGLQKIDGPHDEVIMQHESHGAILPVGPDRPAGKGWIADGEIETCRQVGASEIAGENTRPWL